MSVKTESMKIENGKATFEIEIEAEVFEQAVEQAYKKNVGKMNIPGFRKGKAPRKIIERQFGAGVFYEDAINNVLPEAYDKAVEEMALEPIDRPDVDIVRVGGEETTILKICVELKPEIKVDEYKGIEVSRIEYNVSDEDVENEIKGMAERNGRLVTIEDRAAENGDVVTIDFEGFLGEVPFEGGKGENYDLTIGSGQFIPGFEEQIIGKNTGEEFLITVTFPSDYQSEELAGKDAEFKIKLHTIKNKELPEMDDEFAKDVSEFDTLEELKTSIRIRMEESAKERQTVETQNAVIDKIIETVELEVPEVMIEDQIRQIAMDMDRRLQSQGLNLQKYFELTGMTFESFKEQNREQAVAQVKATLTVEAICKKEGISVTDEEVEQEYKDLAEKYKTELEQVKQYIDPKTVKHDLEIRKTVEMLVENAKII